MDPWIGVQLFSLSRSASPLAGTPSAFSNPVGSIKRTTQQLRASAHQQRPWPAHLRASSFMLSSLDTHLRKGTPMRGRIKLFGLKTPFRTWNWNQLIFVGILTAFSAACSMPFQEEVKGPIHLLDRSFLIPLETLRTKRKMKRTRAGLPVLIS